MGKTPKPLKIAIHGSLLGQPWVAELQAKGHTVELLVMVGDPDLILAPQAARFLPGMEKYLDALIKGARRVKYPGKKDA